MHTFTVIISDYVGNWEQFECESAQAAFELATLQEDCQITIFQDGQDVSRQDESWDDWLYRNK